MKLKELKHNHSLTDLLKILIFSVLMITPLLSVATRCLYVICNKNAYQSYYGETVNEINTTYIKTRDNLKTNNIYVFNSNNYVGSEIQGKDFYLSSQRITLEVEEVISNPNNYNIPEVISISWYKPTADASYYMYAYNEDNTAILNGATSINLNLIFKFRYLSNNLPNDSFFTLTNCIYEEIYNSYSYLDNVFEYSINKLEESQIINWTSNTGVYTGVNAMTTQLGIEGTVIPMLITYWFLLTIIYVIIDIVLKLFIVLTHLIGSKTT